MTQINPVTFLVYCSATKVLLLIFSYYAMMLKRLLAVISLLVVAIFLLLWYASSPGIDSDHYYTTVDYAIDTTQELQLRLKEQPHLVVMTYNLGYLSGMTNNRSITREESFFRKNLFKACELIQGIDPTIVGLQEVDFGAARSFYLNQLDSLSKAGQYTSAYRSINWDKNYVPFPYWPPSNHFGQMLSGQAILSKYKLHSSETVVLTPHLNAPFYYKAFYLDRLLQISILDFFDTEIAILNVHLEAFDLQTRLEQIEIVKRHYEKYASKQPVILLGDFNSGVPGNGTEQDAVEALMDASFIRSAIPFKQAAQNGTFPSDSVSRMIDYVFYNKNFLSCTEASAVHEVGAISDHLPVVARFSLN
ncbi:MAG: endonuclease/exonuclease/phosphatase family protein [Bacteroidota bacterium]